jgi:transmembrane sensor
MYDSPIERAQALLEKYRQGRCTPAEMELLQDWYENLDAVSAIETEIPKELEVQLETAILQKIKRPAPVRRIGWRYAAAAAIAGILLVGSIYLARNSGSHATPAIVYHETFNDQPAPRNIKLPDGSNVWLNTGSSIQWNETAFGKTDRAVTLKGEGFFDVVKDKEHPFIVSSGNVFTKVLGTVFNVEAYSGEQQVRIALVEGKVELREKNDTALAATLKPGQVASSSGTSNRIEVTEQNTSLYGQWIHGGMSLVNVSIADALKRVCRKYGYQVNGVLKQEDRDKVLTIHFAADQGAEEMITNILYIHHIEFTISNNTVYIK